VDKDLPSRTKVVMDGGALTVPINKKVYSTFKLLLKQVPVL
jgi:hypothetical protein